ncbi:hypothetical protein ISCGN_004052 [Ixodes scapularis]
MDGRKRDTKIAFCTGRLGAERNLQSWLEPIDGSGSGLGFAGLPSSTKGGLRRPLGCPRRRSSVGGAPPGRTAEAGCRYALFDPDAGDSEMVGQSLVIGRTVVPGCSAGST